MQLISRFHTANSHSKLQLCQVLHKVSTKLMDGAKFVVSAEHVVSDTHT